VAPALFFCPAFLRCFLGYFLASFWRHLVGSRSPASLSTQSPQFHGGLIPVIRLGVWRLASSDVANHLGQRKRITRAFFPFLRHVTIIAQTERNRIASSRCSHFKLTHYPSIRGAYQSLTCMADHAQDEEGRDADIGCTSRVLPRDPRGNDYRSKSGVQQDGLRRHY
jgi:hypothetical protein